MPLITFQNYKEIEQDIKKEHGYIKTIGTSVKWKFRHDLNCFKSRAQITHILLAFFWLTLRSKIENPHQYIKKEKQDQGEGDA